MDINNELLKAPERINQHQVNDTLQASIDHLLNVVTTNVEARYYINLEHVIESLASVSNITINQYVLNLNQIFDSQFKEQFRPLKAV